MKISIQKLEEVLKSGVTEVTDCGESLLVETKMGSFELSYHSLETFILKEETLASEKAKELSGFTAVTVPMQFPVATSAPADAHAETRKLEKPVEAKPFIHLGEEPFIC